MRYFAHDVVATGGPMSPLLSLGMASSLYLGHEDQMEWGANWPEWYWPAYEMMDAMANLVNWEFASFPGVYAAPDGYSHRAGSYAAALAWADETEQSYIDASTWFIATCGLVWPRLPADPYDYIRN